KVTPVHLMHERNDPNHKFTDLEFALFPLNRLKRGTTYRAEVEYEANGNTKNIFWEFTTKESRYPVFEINANQQYLSLKQNITYAVYVPPENQLPYIEQLRWESSPSLNTDVVWEDKNTLLITLSGEPCKQAKFSMNGNRSFYIQLSDQDNLNDDQYYPKKSVLSCILQTVKDMSGFKIQGTGETLKMESGKEYWVEVEADNEVTNELKMRYIEGMLVKVKHLGQNLIRISLTGSPGQNATFFLKNSKSFEAIIANEN
ncbi:hypothetical protein KKA14_05515, partial [bacterium]|nr:hypothetical protein [bacterium]